MPKEEPIHKRLSYFAIPNQPHATLTPAAITYLVETFDQNLRQMEYFLYEVWQQLDGIESVDALFTNFTYAHRRRMKVCNK